MDCLATIDFDDERSAGSCTYVDPDTRERFNVKQTAQDQTVTVYERRTGRQVAKKRFKAPRPRCDKKTLVGTTENTSYPDDAKMEKFIRKSAR